MLIECTNAIILTSVCITTYNYHSYCYDSLKNTIITNLPKSKCVFAMLQHIQSICFLCMLKFMSNKLQSGE